MDRPKIHVSRTRFETLCEIAGLIALVALTAVPAVNWPQLPDTVPTHFTLQGQPDAWGSRAAVWLLPVIGMALYAGLTVLQRYPHLYNYPWPITADNAVRQYLLARTLIRVLKIELLAIFAWLNWAGIQTALGRAPGLPSTGLLLVLAVVGGTIVIYVIVARRAR